VRVLFFPLYTSTSVNHCTTYIFAKNVIRAIVESDPSAFVYLPIPQAKEGEEPQDYSAVMHPRVKLLPMNITTKQLQGMLEFPKEITDLFNDRTGRYFVDAVLTTAHTQTAQMRPIFSVHRKGWSIDPLWVNFIMFGIGDSTPLPETYRLQQAVGMLSADVTVYQSKTSQDRVFQSLRRILSPFSCKKILDSTHPMPITSVPMTVLDSVPRKEKPRDHYVVSYGYAMHDTYNYKEIFELFDGVFCAGRKVRVLATTSSGGYVMTSPKWREIFDKRYKKYFEFTYRLSQRDFWTRASEAHAFLFLAKQAESSFSVIEQFMLDQIGVFYESGYAREVTYPGYPYICRGYMEAATTLRYVLENYFSPTVQEVLEKQKAYLREKFDIEKNSVKFHADMREKVNALRSEAKPSPEIVKLTHELFENRDRLTWAEFAEGVKKNSENGIDVNKTAEGSRGRSYWRWVVEQAGYPDECQGEDPVFIRREP
jgi:hypothetical protein